MQTKAYSIDRSWIKITGKDAERFLQGMATNHIGFTVAESKKQDGGPVVSLGLVLDTKGRAVSPWTCLVWQGEFWMSVPTVSKEALLQHLDRYIIADDVTLKSDVIPNGFEKSFFVFVEEQDIKNAKIPNLVNDAKDYVGSGQLKNNNELWLPTAHGFEVWTQGGVPQNCTMINSTEFVGERIAHAMPEWLKDFNQETLILEMPFESQVSFFKGCYLGQEVVARGTFRGKMPKGLCRVEGQSKLSEGLLYVDEGGEERPVGKLTSVYENKALGVLRFAAIQEPLQIYSKNLDGSKNMITKIEALIGGNTN